MADRLLKLRYPATCAHCASSLTPGDQGWWDSESRIASCTRCRPPGADRPPITTAASERLDSDGLPALPSMNPPGGSAQQEYLKRHQRRESQIEQRWGRLSGVVKFLSDDPQSTKAWAKGSEGERKLAAHLVRSIGEHAIMLHDRRIPGTRANIDHLVVAATGVWIIDAKSYRGKVEQRDVGGWFTTDRRLFVDGRDRSALATGLFKQTLAVLTALDNVALDVDVMAALCFVDSEWALFAKPFLQAGVLVTWPKLLCKAISELGSLNRDQIVQVAECLANGLPAATPH